MKRTILQRISLLAALLFLFSSSAWSDEMLKPFELVSNEAGDFKAAVDSTKNKLTAGGFTVAGEYSPYDGAHVIVVTSDELQAAASKTEFGGYGAIIRVAVTQNADKVEVTYSNPVYWSNAYLLEGNGSAIAAKMKSAMGASEPFGSEKGLTAKKLRKYHYTAFMPYFDNPEKLGKFDSHADALAKINASLAAGKGGVSKVYEIKIPGKDETLIGVAMTEGASADKDVMSKIDVHGTRHTAHLPYPMLVSGKKVYTLSGKFRIALSFPDLSMMGAGSFMEIMDAPPAIKKSLSALSK
jgi:hypothetical protein